MKRHERYPYELRYTGAPDGDGEYEILSRHRTYRAACAKLLDLESSAKYYNNLTICPDHPDGHTW